MTANQIGYGVLVETRKHNRAQEYETAYHNRQVEGETVRHNVQTEGIGWQQAAAATLSARASMVHAGAAVLGAQASMLGAQTQQYLASETAEHYARQDEVASRNAVTSRIGTTGQNVIGFFNALTNSRNATTRSQEQQEQARHNVVIEGIETGRADSYAKQIQGGYMRDTTQAFGNLVDGLVTVGGMING